MRLDANCKSMKSTSFKKRLPRTVVYFRSVLYRQGKNLNAKKTQSMSRHSGIPSILHLHTAAGTPFDNFDLAFALDLPGGVEPFFILECLFLAGALEQMCPC